MKIGPLLLFGRLGSGENHVFLRPLGSSLDCLLDLFIRNRLPVDRGWGVFLSPGNCSLVVLSAYLENKVSLRLSSQLDQVVIAFRY